MNTESRGAIQLLRAALFASNELQYKELAVSEQQNYSLGSTLDSESVRGAGLNTDLQNSQSYGLYSQTCMLNSCTFLLHQLLEIQSPYVLPLQTLQYLEKYKDLGDE